MPRRTDHTRDELRDLALATATGIVAREGLSGLTARRVAREIGYTIGTIYNIFTDLDDLINHMNARTLDALETTCLKVGDGQTGADLLRRLADAYVAFAHENPGLYGALFEHRQPGAGRPPAWYDRKVSNLLGMIEKSLQPFDRFADPQTAAMTLWASVHGIVMLEITDKLGGAGQAPRLVHELIGHWLRCAKVTSPMNRP